jgi:Cytochrome c554 and c-prime
MVIIQRNAWFLVLGGVILVCAFSGLTSSSNKSRATGQTGFREWYQDPASAFSIQDGTRPFSLPLATCCSLDGNPRDRSSPIFTLADKKKFAKPEPHPERPYLGFKTCLRCHTNGAVGQVDLPGGGKLDLNEEQWVFYNEYPTWVKEDKHGQAYTVLLNKRSKEMGRQLGVSEIHRDSRCLACHTGFPLNQMPVEKDGLVDRDLGKKLDINVGVSCEGCHGSAGDYQADGRDFVKGWMGPHQTAPLMPYAKTNPWRFLSPQAKHEQYGFFDVRSPSFKTKLCVSCHIGDVEQGRIVTHEMYAVGHPPLPGFEIETFTQQMPRHWAEFSAKAGSVQELFLKYTKDPLYREQTYRKDNLHRSRSLLVGALVASGEYLRFAGQLADDASKSPVTKPAWPEFAVFDCYACHHDLTNSSWRQTRNSFSRIPGRPTLHAWPFTLAKIALKTLGMPSADFDAKLADLRQAINRKPFGNRNEFCQAAQTAAAWVFAKSLEREKRPLKQEEGYALLTEISTVASTETLDYDSARQLVWAFRIVESELQIKFPNPDKIRPLVESLSKDMFLLNLRGGRKAVTAIPKETGGMEERSTVEVDLDIVLPYVARYQPLAFQKKFKEIALLLN